MTWIAMAVIAVVVVVMGVVVTRRWGRNSGASRARDVDPASTANSDAHGYAAQHQANLHGGGGLGL